MKTLQNLLKRRNIVLCKNEKRAKSLPTFKAFKTYDEELTAVESLKTSIFMNRPVNDGFKILDLSKLLIYKFHCDFLKKKYKKQVKLLFTDTDSLTYHIQTKDIYSDSIT